MTPEPQQPTLGLSAKETKLLQSALASIPEIEEAVVYGSRARGDNKPYSDIDLTLKGKALTNYHLALLEDKIDYLYLPYFFDISLLSSIKNEALVKNIEREGRILYKAS